MATLNDRLAKLEAAACRNGSNHATWSFPNPARRRTRDQDEHIGIIGYAIEDGHWGQLIDLPEVAAMLHGEMTFAQVARIAELARPHLSAATIGMLERERSMWAEIVRYNEARGCFGLSDKPEAGRSGEEQAT